MNATKCGILVSAALLVMSTMAGAAQPKAKKAVKPTTKPAATAPANQRTQPGMIIVKDAETGQLRAPTAAEINELTGARDTSPSSKQGAAKSAVAQPREEARPDGSFMVRLPESSHVFAVAKIGPDGKLMTDCVEGKEAADKALATRPVSKQTTKTEVLDEK